MSEKERALTDIREALVALLTEHILDEGANGCSCEEWEHWEDPYPERIDAYGKHVADAILAEFEVTGRWEDMWEYGVRWGDDGTVTNYVSRERAEERAAEPYGDKIVRRIAARTLPAGPWEEVPND